MNQQTQQAMTTEKTISRIASRIGKSFSTATPKNTAATFKKEYGIELHGAPIVVKADNGKQSLIFCLHIGYTAHPKPMAVYAQYLPICDTSGIPAELIELIQEANFNPFKY